MPISKDKSISELLYERFPRVYRSEDAQIEVNPYPLKRFLQIAALGMEEVEREIDAMELMFNVDLVPAKYLDPLGRMLGFTFPKGMTDDEKRRLIKNLPMLYKIKGSSQVYEVLARIVFAPLTTRTTTNWKYTKDTTTMEVKLLLQDGMADLEDRIERFVYLIEYFRPINVGLAWTLEIFYEDELILKNFYDPSEIDIIYMDDNVYGQNDYSKTVNYKPHLLNEMQLNSKANLYGILYEYFDFSRYKDTLIDTLYEAIHHEEYSKFQVYLQESIFELNRRGNLNSNGRLSSGIGKLMDDVLMDRMHLSDGEEVFAPNFTIEELDKVHSLDVEDLVSNFAETAEVFHIHALDEEQYEHLYEEVLNEDSLQLFEGEDYYVHGEYMDDELEVIASNDVEEHSLTAEDVEQLEVMYSKEVEELNLQGEDVDSTSLTIADVEEFSITSMSDSSVQSQMLNVKNSLNLGMLGSTMILSKPHEIITYNY